MAVINGSDAFSTVPLDLGEALQARGFTSLTEVQRAVLEPGLAGRDLRISSETGSGKTVALGLAIAGELVEPARAGRVAAPRAVVIAPTRELAAQVGREMTWLLRPLRAGVAVVTGGSSISGDFRALSRAPSVVVGTPGRLLDHVRRGSVELESVSAVVLDEADEMLDMGFRDELEAILEATPDERRTHLVSATLPPDVMRLADRYQRDPLQVAGTDPSAANENITHVAHLVPLRDRSAALINLLLREPEAQTLVFVRTRAASSELAKELAAAGFAAIPLSGDMGQRERNAAVESFRRRQVRVVVATDVAARGLDIDGIARVVHFDSPDNADGYTHRSGRTGRAGNTGLSVALVPPRSRARLERMAARAGVEIRWAPLPTPAEIARAADRRLVGAIDARMEDRPPSARHRELAQSLLAGRDPVDLLAALLERPEHSAPCEPREIEAPAPPKHRRDGGRQDRRTEASEDYARFFVSWGAAAGASPSRLLAMVCRRGGVRGAHIGAIKIGPHHSVVEVASRLADDFGRRASVRDSRNPRVKIAPWCPGPPTA
jgi:ATP-dependent RNA helicase DeaD